MIRAEENPGLACWWLVEWFVYNYPLVAVAESALEQFELEFAFVVEQALGQVELEPAFVVESAGLAEEQAAG